MKKSYNNKQQNKQQSTQNQRNSKLYKAHAELGQKEHSKKNKQYYTILTNGRILDYTSSSPIFAKIYFAQEAGLHGGEFDGTVRAYK
jgi:hypothetical protein